MVAVTVGLATLPGLIQAGWIRAGYITRVAYKLKSAKKSKTGYFENVYIIIYDVKNPFFCSSVPQPPYSALFMTI